MSRTASVRLRSIAAGDAARVAIVARDRAWSYGELDAAVERMAGWLHDRRVGDNGSDIAVFRYRSTVPLIISSLALSRAGLVSALVDPFAPPARVRLVLEDLTVGTRSPIFVTDSADDLVEHPTACLFADLPESAPGTPLPESAERGDDDLQNVIYTSGSTGVPVGLRVNGHQRHAIDGWARTFEAFKEGARAGVIAAGSMGQGAEFPRIIVATGGTMVVHDVLTDGVDTIPRWLREQRVEALGLVPTLIRFLLPLLEAQLDTDGVLPDLATVAVWGESADWDDVARLYRLLPPHAVIHNAYATTETGMIAALSPTRGEVGPVGTRTGPVPAGYALPGVDVRILDAAGSEQPAWVAGEISVSSPHLADGHWRRPDLTASVFTTGPDGRRICRTGDGGTIDPDGLLHVHGRLDDVVKISGHRVALGELEVAAREQHGVAAAAAAARADAHDAARLHLYVVADPGAVLEPRWLRSRLARSLPPSMLPDTVTVLDALPVLPNGKVDRRSLPEPATRPAEPSATDGNLVRELQDLFREVLGDTKVGPDDDFFDIGGDSLRAGRLIGALQTRLGRYLPTSLLLEASTPTTLAAAMSSDGDPLLVPVRTSGAGAPLFVIHGGSGEVMFARTLAANLQDDRPVYALQPPRLVGPEPFVPTLQAMAERYVTEIRRVAPAGPYRLFGYSLGGLIAFEMATLLQDAGDEVELLALGDIQVPELMVSSWQEDRSRAQTVERDRRIVDKVTAQLRHRGGQLRHRLDRVPRRTVQWRQFRSGEEPAPEIRAEAYLSVYGPLAATHTIRTPFAGDVVLIASTAPGPADRGWHPYVDGHLAIVSIETDHLGLVDEPAVRQVSEALSVPART